MYVNARLTALATKRVELELQRIECVRARERGQNSMQTNIDTIDALLEHLDAEIEVSKSYLNAELQAQMESTLRSTLSTLKDIDLEDFS